MLFLLNLLPNFQNEHQINLENLLGNIEFGGTIPDDFWMGLSDNFSLQSLLTRTSMVYPRVHDFLVNLTHNSKDINLNILDKLTQLTFDGKSNETDLISNFMAFEINNYLLRVIFRFKKGLESQEYFSLLKKSLKPWKNVKTFIANNLYNYDQFDERLIGGIFEKIKKLFGSYSLDLPFEFPKDHEKITKDDLLTIEDFLAQAKLKYLRMEFLKGNNDAKIISVLLQIILEKKNLTMLFYGKSQGFDNNEIINKMNIL